MKEYTNVPCPSCGGNLDVLLQPTVREFTEDYADHTVTVQFTDQTVEHTCKREEK